MEACVAPLRKRFDFATELRGFAEELERLSLANHRDPEAPLVAKQDLADRMRNRANAVMERDDPVERGVITARTLFREPARPVKVEVRRLRLAA